MKTKIIISFLSLFLLISGQSFANPTIIKEQYILLDYLIDQKLSQKVKL